MIERIVMTGEPVAVAGPGSVLFQVMGHQVGYFLAVPGFVGRPDIDMRVHSGEREPIEVPNGVNLFLTATAGSVAAVMRDAAPIEGA